MQIVRDNNAVKRIINRLTAEQQAKTKKAIEVLYKLLSNGTKADEAVKKAMEIVALDGAEIKSALVEATAYGYGIVPKVLTETDKELIGNNIGKAWNADGFTLSQKLYNADVAMKNEVVAIISQQLRKNAGLIDTARKLYDGYGYGHILTQQQAADYIHQVRVATSGDLDALRKARRATNNIMRLSKNGAPNQALKAAYLDVIKAAELNSAEALREAIYVAMEEKSRYVAERIIRTETAKAYADGFIAEAANDSDVVAYQFKLSTRHPIEDICDMYADADLYGLGAGIYPKDECPPIPVHPHCLCHYAPVYRGEVNMQDLDRANVEQKGKEWLAGLKEEERERILGVGGNRLFENGESWLEELPEFDTSDPTTRLSKNTINELKTHL